MAVLPRLVAAGLALVLGADVFVVYGTDVTHHVSARAAVARYRRHPGPPVTRGPRPGVYLYDTAGSSQVDRLGVHREYPAVTARIVRGRGCGWREEVPVFTEHVETYDHCGDEQTGFGTRLTYFFVPSVIDLTCRAGACTDPAHHVTATVAVTAEGPGAALVGAVSMPCRRFTVRTVLRGSNTGSATRYLCVSPDGLVLSEERFVGVETRNAFVGRVVYTERASFRLRSLEPLT